MPVYFLLLATTEHANLTDPPVNGVIWMKGQGAGEPLRVGT